MGGARPLIYRKTANYRRVQPWFRPTEPTFFGQIEILCAKRTSMCIGQTYANTSKMVHSRAFMSVNFRRKTCGVLIFSMAAR